MSDDYASDAYHVLNENWVDMVDLQDEYPLIFQSGQTANSLMESALDNTATALDTYDKLSSFHGSDEIAQEYWDKLARHIEYIVKYLVDYVDKGDKSAINKILKEFSGRRTTPEEFYFQIVEFFEKFLGVYSDMYPESRSPDAWSWVLP